MQLYYGYSKQEISAALVPLLVDHGLKVEGSRTVTGALESMAEERVRRQSSSTRFSPRRLGLAARAWRPLTRIFANST